MTVENWFKSKFQAKETFECLFQLLCSEKYIFFGISSKTPYKILKPQNRPDLLNDTFRGSILQF